MEEGCYLWIRLIRFFMVCCAAATSKGNSEPRITSKLIQEMQINNETMGSNELVPRVANYTQCLLICNIVLCMFGCFFVLFVASGS